MSFPRSWFARIVAPLSTLAAVLSFAVTISAQISVVQYGDGVHQGAINAALQSDRYLLVGAQQGDILRITFCGAYTGYPVNAYNHRLDVSLGGNPVGAVDGCGALTATLTTSSTYTITVRARNNQSIGWYAFQIDRLNDPVGADRIGFNWHMSGSLTTATAFTVYTIHALAGNGATLNFTSDTTGYPCFCWNHYAEILDPTGQRLAVADGGSTPASITFPADGIYTVFVAAQDFQRTGNFVVSVDCPTWPITPCDCTAASSNYGRGWPGTLGVPSLTASSSPRLGTTVGLGVGNSYGALTQALVLLGFDAANQTIAAYGGTVLVAHPTVLPPVTLQPTGGTLGLPIPNDPILCGIAVAMQSLVIDPGAPPAQIAFSRGLLLVLGN